MGRAKDDDGTPKRRRKRSYGAGSPYQDKHGQWWAAIYQNGRQRRFRCASEQAAKAKLKSLNEQKQQHISIGAARMTLQAYLNTWLETVVLPNKKPKTYRFYRQICEDYIVPRIGGVKLDALEAMNIRAMLANLKQGGFSEQTCKHAYQVLRGALEVAVADHKLPFNPAASVEPPKVTREDIVPFSRKEAALIRWSVESHRLSLLYDLGLSLGCRKGELLGVRIGAIDLKAGTITIDQQVLDLPMPRIEPYTKNDEIRVLPLTPRLIGRVRERMARLLDERNTAGEAWKEHGLLFPSEHGTPMSERNLDRHWKATCVKANIRTYTRKNKHGKEITTSEARFHWLRHSVASWLDECGITIETKAAILGHGQQGITGRYVHVPLASQRAALEALERFVFDEGESKKEATG